MGLPRGQGSQVLAEQDPAGSPWQCWPGLFPEVSPAPVPAVRVGTASSPWPLWNGGKAHALTQTRTHCTHRHTCAHSLHTVTHVHTFYTQSYMHNTLFTHSHTLAHTLQTVTYTAQSLHTVTHAQHTCHTHTLYTQSHTHSTLFTHNHTCAHTLPTSTLTHSHRLTSSKNKQPSSGTL